MSKVTKGLIVSTAALMTLATAASVHASTSTAYTNAITKKTSGSYHLKSASAKAYKLVKTTKKHKTTYKYQAVNGNLAAKVKQTIKLTKQVTLSKGKAKVTIYYSSTVKGYLMMNELAKGAYKAPKKPNAKPTNTKVPTKQPAKVDANSTKTTPVVTKPDASGKPDDVKPVVSDSSSADAKTSPVTITVAQVRAALTGTLMNQAINNKLTDSQIQNYITEALNNRNTGVKGVIGWIYENGPSVSVQEPITTVNVTLNTTPKAVDFGKVGDIVDSQKLLTESHLYQSEVDHLRTVAKLVGTDWKPKFAAVYNDMAAQKYSYPSIATKSVMDANGIMQTSPVNATTEITENWQPMLDGLQEYHELMSQFMQFGTMGYNDTMPNLSTLSSEDKAVYSVLDAYNRWSVVVSLIENLDYNWLGNTTYYPLMDGKVPNVHDYENSNGGDNYNEAAENYQNIVAHISTVQNLSVGLYEAETTADDNYVF
ncbi:hypothetical protein EQG49_00400 [Periweissella cryptocerci]|uniref:Uncharacterized protein n=1 Tax=Periweissella cryptocerci TaxID=2506420 RepID=A0A4P6YQY3_9LACO|nr:hypothetical protein [Periweissella cryptocerci]QBO35014.1 hypothetical protein EQG49_00400 [Periweissella cryptocerci]